MTIDQERSSEPQIQELVTHPMGNPACHVFDQNRSSTLIFEKTRDILIATL